jgi:hypothetical protein
MIFQRPLPSIFVDDQILVVPEAVDSDVALGVALTLSSS